VDAPARIYTFLFTDIEGSTRLWESEPEIMRSCVEKHDQMARASIGMHGGEIFRTLGDAFFAAFEGAEGAVNSALHLQQSLMEMNDEAGPPILVRMAVYTGAASPRDDDYFGPALNRAARLLSVAHGGQVLLSASTVALVRDWLPDGAGLKNLGAHKLRDVASPEVIHQLTHESLMLEFPRLPSVEIPDNNLPRELTSFVGREAELTYATGLLDQTSLLTLTGSGGCGKTRLALELAADLVPKFPHGVWLVELASIVDAAHVPNVVAAVLGIRAESARPIEVTLREHLRDKTMLLVLDNCEHLVHACAEFVDQLLRFCPSLKILCTSREAIGVPGEITWKVPSLTVPTAETEPSMEVAQQFESVQLFLSRARQANPSFEMTESNIPSIYLICSRLDGIPLAIELAAARVRLLPLEELASRLSDRFRVLTGGSRTALPRQQTLRATIEWSYNLLDESEQLLLQRLSVFSGGWTLESAESICGFGAIENWAILDLLSQLNLKSLVVFEERPIAARYSMLESLRQYARDQLFETDSGLEVRDRHADFFRVLVANAETHVNGPDQVHWLQLLDEEHDNIRAALDWTLAGSRDRREVLHFAKSLHRFWEVRGFVAEGRAWLTKALQSPVERQSADARMRALNALGDLEKHAGEHDAAIRRFNEALAIAEELDYERGKAILKNNIGLVLLEHGEYEAAAAAFEESFDFAKAAQSNADIARALDNMGSAKSALGIKEEAFRLHGEAKSLWKELSDERSLCINSYFFAELFRKSERPREALGEYAASLGSAKTVGIRIMLAACQEGIAKLFVNCGRYAEAESLFNSADRIRTEAGEMRSSKEQKEFESYLQTIHAHLATTSGQPNSEARPKTLTFDETLALLSSFG